MDKNRIIIDFNPSSGMWYVLSINRSYCTGFIKDVKKEIERRMRKMSGSYYNKAKRLFNKK